MNNFNKNEQKFNQFDEFESFDVATLETRAENISTEEKNAIESLRSTQIESDRDALMSLYEKNELSDRDTSSFESSRREVETIRAEAEETIFLSDYSASFAGGYGDREGFSLRANQKLSQDYLNESIKLTKSEEKVIPLSKKTANIGKAALITLGIGKIA